MLFENLRVNRVTVHEVFQRSTDRSFEPPIFAKTLEQLSSEALGAFQLRLTDALSGQSQSLHMRITKYNDQSYLTLAESIVGSTDKEFLSKSEDIALRLADAQIARRIPGGMLLVFDGWVGASDVPFFGVIKAETQAGFRRSRNGEETVIEFLKNIFLTPATRLYKIGLMLFSDRTQPIPEGRLAFVFDSNISLSNREAAAAYFYEAFLGCALPEDGPYETAKFFDLTKEFINKTNLPPDQKRNTIDSLYVFVRDEKDVTFTVDQYCSRFIPAELRDNYTTFMRLRKFTANAVVRDVSRMGRRLHRRKLKFGSEIELLASPEALRNKIVIGTIKSDLDDPLSQWTQVIIKELLTGEQ